MVSRAGWLGLLGLLVGSAGCGVSDEPPSTLWSNTVVVTSENRSELMLGLAEVTCRADGERLLVTSGEVAREGGTVDSAVLEVSVDPSRVETGRDYSLGSDEDAVRVSVLVPAPSANPPAPQRANRASSTLGGSEGTLRFETLSCGDEPGVSLAIDAVLASAYDDRGPVPVEGELWVTSSGMGQ